MKALALFPNQLFEPKYFSHLDFQKIVLIEHPLFFKDKVYPLDFHIQKLILHRASMKAYHHTLTQLGYSVDYLEYAFCSQLGQFFDYLIANYKFITFFDPVDFILEKRIKKHLKGNIFQILDTPYFLNSKSENQTYFGKNPFFQHKFYIHQRKKFKILVDTHLQPDGGKWSYDAENRKKLPKNISIPATYSFHQENFTQIQEAKKYVLNLFPQARGFVDEFIYPITHDQADQALQSFLIHKFTQFGEYEDAIDINHSYLFHSVLSPAINIGIITPDKVIAKTLSFAEQNDIPLNSLEGFIRQIISWREFIRASYDIKGVEVRNSNFWNHTNSIPSTFYNGETGVLPVDQTIHKLLNTAYNHHIERLMILGNFMCLCQIHPDQVYKWFMEMYIDAYDWVMVPNVYSMSQFADGGNITTKPYISSANYVSKMSNYPKGDWETIWTALYWNFINNHKSFFQSNFRLNMMVKTLEKMPTEKFNLHITTSSNFLKNLKNT